MTLRRPFVFSDLQCHTQPSCCPPFTNCCKALGSCWACASWAAGCLLGARGDNDDGDDDDDTGGHGDDDDDDEDGDAGCLRGAGGAAGNSLGVSSASKQSGNQCIWSNHLGFFFVSSFILILDFFVNILKLARHHCRLTIC